MQKNVILFFVSVVLLFFPMFITSCSQEALAPSDQSTTDQALLKNSATQDYVQGILDGGAIYRIYMPDEWNEDLVIFAHGYVAVTEPVAIPESHLILPDGTSIPELINSMGYAFATTSYRANGMVVQEALIDLVELAWKFEELYGEPEHNFLVGASEGGLITTKSLEMKRLYHGGLAVCGPVGDFLKQVNYMGDFRVLFDFYFPGILPGDPMNIPQEVMDNWDSVYLPKIIAAISAEPEKTLELLLVAKAPFDPADPETAGQTVAGILWYNVFVTNDLASRVGGNPFDNTTRRYHGSSNDVVLNAGVQRIQGEQDAINNLKAMFDTYGAPREPLITMHTVGDPIVPFWHERLYRKKVNVNGSPGLYHNIPVMRYGHCNFTTEEVLTGFALLIFQVTGKELFDPPHLDKRPLVSAQETWYKNYLHLK